MKTTNTNLLDYSKINVIDMCYFLNDRADLTSNEYLKKFSPLLFSEVEMYEFIKFKTDNFNIDKFQLVFNEICEFCFTYMDFYKLEKVDGKIRNKYVSDYDVDYSIESCKPLEYINSTLELNKGLIVNSNCIIDFVKLAENLYQKHCQKETTTTLDKKTHGQLKTNLTDDQRGKLFDLLVLNGFIPDKDKEGFIWAFGGVNDKYTSYSTEWLKKDNLAVYLVDRLCFDNNVKIQDSYLNRMGKIFGIKNPRQSKKGYENNKNGTPNGYELIDKIISEQKN